MGCRPLQATYQATKQPFLFGHLVVRVLKSLLADWNWLDFVDVVLLAQGADSSLFAVDLAPTVLQTISILPLSKSEPLLAVYS